MNRDRIAVVAFLLPLLAVAGCGRSGSPSFPGAPVILISVDTLRSDHLPAYGYKGVETPSLDRLRRDAILFERAYAHIPLTLPSHASLLTGVLPGANGVHDNLGYPLNASVPTLAELLKKSGYATGGAISAVVLNGGTGISRGFDFYEDTLEPSEAHQALSAVQRGGAETIRHLSAWMDKTLAERPRDPLFAFLHVYEPHAPYEPPEPFRSRFPSRYDGEIAYTDSLVGGFLDHLKARGVYDRVLVIFLSDHGEGLGDHGEDEHGVFLYREALQVPLFVKLPDQKLAGTSVKTPVGLCDVFTTVGRVLGLSGFPEHPETVSLIDLAAGASPPERRLFAESFFPRVHFGWSEPTSLLDERWHLIEAPRPEFFDLAADPAEKDNLAAEKPGNFRKMRIELAKRRAPFEAPGEVDPEEAKKLAALGYLSTGASAGPGPLADPKDMIGTVRLLNDAVARVQKGRPEEAVELFQRLLKENPRMTDVWELYSQALLDLGLPEPALLARKKMVELAPKTATHPLLSVANLCLQIGKVDEALAHANLAKERGDSAAEEVLARAYLTKGDLASAEAAALRGRETGKTRRRSTLVLARIQMTRGDLPKATALVRDVESTLAERNESPPVGFHQLKGEILARSGQPAKAQTEFENEIRRSPRAVDARINLAILHASERRPLEMRRTIEELLKAVPTVEAYTKGARALEVLGDPRGAEEVKRRGRGLFPEEPWLRARSR